MKLEKFNSTERIIDIFLVIFFLVWVVHFYHVYNVKPKHKEIDNIIEIVNHSFGKLKVASDLCRRIESAEYPENVMNEVIRLIHESDIELSEIKYDTKVSAESSRAILDLKEWISKLYMETKSMAKCQENTKTADEIEKWRVETLKKINLSKKWY